MSPALCTTLPEEGFSMKSVSLIAHAIILMASTISAAHALNFKSVGDAPAILYDAPSEKGIRVFVAPRGMPVEVVLTYGDWSKIRDAAGTLTWIRSNALNDKRNVVINVANAKVRSAANEQSPVVFSADKHVLLEVEEPAASGWVKVKHQSGQAGYVKGSEVWGG
jgi:SH3-like domain-containing protein